MSVHRCLDIMQPDLFAMLEFVAETPNDALKTCLAAKSGIVQAQTPNDIVRDVPNRRKFFPLQGCNHQHRFVVSNTVSLAKLARANSLRKQMIIEHETLEFVAVGSHEPHFDRAVSIHYIS